MVSDALKAETTDDAAALRQAFLAAMRQVPAPVAIVAAGAPGGRRGLVATAWTSLTADPPMLLVCVNQSASAHDVIQSIRRFSVNVVTAANTELIAVFSNQRGLKDDARFDDAMWVSEAAGPPSLRSALVSFDCTLAESHFGQTHSILTGAVNVVRATVPGEALLYHDGRFAIAARIDT